MSDVGYLTGSGVIKDKEGNSLSTFEFTSKPINKKKLEKFIKEKGDNDHADHSPNNNKK